MSRHIRGPWATRKSELAGVIREGRTRKWKVAGVIREGRTRKWEVAGVIREGRTRKLKAAGVIREGRTRKWEVDGVIREGRTRKWETASVIREGRARIRHASGHFDLHGQPDLATAAAPDLRARRVCGTEANPDGKRWFGLSACSTCWLMLSAILSLTLLAAPTALRDAETWAPARGEVAVYDDSLEVLVFDSDDQLIGALVMALPESPDRGSIQIDASFPDAYVSAPLMFVDDATAPEPGSAIETDLPVEEAKRRLELMF